MNSALFMTIVALAAVSIVVVFVGSRIRRMVRARRDRLDRIGARLSGAVSVAVGFLPRRLRALWITLGLAVSAMYATSEAFDFARAFGGQPRALPFAFMLVHDAVPAAALLAACWVIARRRGWKARRHHAMGDERVVIGSAFLLVASDVALHFVDARFALPAHAIALLGSGVVFVTSRSLDVTGRVLRVFFRDLDDGLRLATVLPPEFGVRDALHAKTAELRERFLRDGRVAVSELLPPEVARRVAAAIAKRKFELGGKSPVGGLDEIGPNYLAYASRLEAKPGTESDPLCAFAASLMDGALRDWIREITALPRLVNRTGEDLEPVAMAQAFTKGCYFGAHTDLVTLQHDEVKIVVVWHATEDWDPSWGGLLRFFDKAEGFRDDERNPDTCEGYEGGEIWVPRFNELHILRAEKDGVHEVTMVTTEEKVRYTLAARLLEPVEAMVGA